MSHASNSSAVYVRGVSVGCGVGATLVQRGVTRCSTGTYCVEAVHAIATSVIAPSEANHPPVTTHRP